MPDAFSLPYAATAALGPPLRWITAACASRGLDFFVIGAVARELLLEHVYHGTPWRSTRDVDIALAVENWPAFESLLDALVTEHGFRRTAEHRVVREDVEIDVIPFGDVAATGQLIWPSERGMSVLGFQEAFEGAVFLRLTDGEAGDDDFSLRVASLPGIVLLKLIAWSETPAHRAKDAVDFYEIMRQYERVVGDALFHDHADLLEDPAFEVRVAYAHIRGREVAPLLRTPPLRDTLLDLLDRHTRHAAESPLTEAMAPSPLADHAHVFRCLCAFRQGLVERLTP